MPGIQAALDGRIPHPHKCGCSIRDPGPLATLELKLNPEDTDRGFLATSKMSATAHAGIDGLTGPRPARATGLQQQTLDPTLNDVRRFMDSYCRRLYRFAFVGCTDTTFARLHIILKPQPNLLESNTCNLPSSCRFTRKLEITFW